MSDDLGNIKNNLERVLEKVNRAAERSHRSLDEVKLVAVSKKQPLERVEAAIQAGARIFGENYPEEAVLKIQQLSGKSIEWHMIGHLQSRKAGIVAGYFQHFHALDSLRLAVKLNRVLAEKNTKLPVLLEVNIGDEPSKFGWNAGAGHHWDHLRADLEQMAGLERLNIEGLMIMPPYGLAPEMIRPYFIEVRHLFDELRRQFPQYRWRELSMGTSSDYEIAVQEGATFIRVGQAIFGSRPKPG